MRRLRVECRCKQGGLDGATYTQDTCSTDDQQQIAGIASLAEQELLLP